MNKEELWNRLHGKVTGHNAILLAVSLIFMGVCVWDVLHSLYWQSLIAVIILKRRDYSRPYGLLR